MAPTDEQWMHSCLQSADVSRRISLQVKTWERKATNIFKTHQSDLVRIQNHKFSNVKCSERGVKDSELIEAGQHFVSRELLHSFTCFTCYTSQGHTRCQKSRLRLFIEISCVHHGNGCLQFGPSPGMQEATWATRYQLLKWTSFDLYITVYYCIFISIYILYCRLRIESLDRSVSSTTGWRKNSRSSALATAEKTRQAFHGISSFPESSQDFFVKGSKCMSRIFFVAPCSYLLVAPCSFSFPQALSRTTPVGRSRNVNGSIDAGQAPAPGPRHIRPICNDLRTWKVTPL